MSCTPTPSYPFCEKRRIAVLRIASLLLSFIVIFIYRSVYKYTDRYICCQEVNIEYFGEYALTQNSVLVGVKEKTERF